MKKIDLNKLEETHFEIDKKAFKPKTLNCSGCKVKMKKTGIEVALAGRICMKLEGFECPKCRKKYLGLEEAKKMDKAMIISRMIRNDFKLERSLSFDGDNYTFRVPKELTRNVKKKKIEIMPLGASEFCAMVR